MKKLLKPILTNLLDTIKYSPWAAQLIWHSPAGMESDFPD